MDTLEIIGASSKSTLFIGEKLENMSAHLPSSQVVIITDAHVRNLYQGRFPIGSIIEIGLGEAHKTLETIQHIYRELVNMEADRGLFMVGIGGGIVCDVTGFAASTYQRGVRFGFAATTLLAQVDASVGGKNGVNFIGYKNMVGVFNQPQFVICDPEVLGTLSDQDRGCGLGEVVKHAAIADDQLFGYLEDNVEKILALNPQAVHKMVYDSVVIKSGNRQPGRKGSRGAPAN